MASESMITAGFAGRHETFTPRYGWLKKGFDACARNPHVFTDVTAIEQLGVGKNMVQSMRYWCQVFRLIEEAPKDQSRSKGEMVPTRFARRLLDKDQGWDPFIEDPGTLWLLHWQLFRPPFMAVSWALAFNSPPRIFDQKELSRVIIKEARNRPALKSLSDSAFEKDASCIIRMYAPSVRSETEIRCPFTELGLIEPTVDKGLYRFSTEMKQLPPPYVFLAAVFSYADLVQSGAKSLSLSQIAYGENSPGIAFRLSETECGRILEQVVDAMPGVSLVETDGIRQLQFSTCASEFYEQCLATHYSGASLPCC